MRVEPLENYRAVIQEYLDTGETPESLLALVSDNAGQLLLAQGPTALDSTIYKKLCATRAVLLELYPHLNRTQEHRSDE